MKPTKFLPMMALMALLSFSCSTENFPDETIDAVTLANAPAAKAIEIEILELINQYRISEGLNALGSIDVIKGQAYSHTGYMIEVNDVNHDYFHSRKAYLEANANAISVSENVAYGFTNAQSVVNAWLNSSGHKQNIEGDFTHFEISAEKDENNKWYFTNIFIKK